MSKELAKNYPRGEKFLYSVFSKFSTYDTLSLFSELEVKHILRKTEEYFLLQTVPEMCRKKY